MNTSFSVDGKVVVITGGSGTICSAIGRGMAEAGAKIVLINRRQANGQAVADQIIAAGGDAIALSADVLDKPSLTLALEAVLKKYGKVDVLINGAGGNHPDATINKDHDFFELDSEAFKNVLNLNVTGAFLASQVFGEKMAKRGEGVIINIGSMTSYLPLTNVVAYSAAKAATLSFTQWLATHFNLNYSTRIRVNAIAPGFLIGEQNRALLQNPDGTPTLRGEKILAKTPMQRYADPDEMVGAVIFLCSEAASFINGVCLPIDGGFSSYWGV